MGRPDSARWVITLVGELDALTAPIFVAAAEAIPPECSVDVHSNDLTFCDSDGFRSIVAFAARRPLPPVVLRDPCVWIVRLAELLGLPDYVRVEYTDAPRPAVLDLGDYDVSLREAAGRLRNDSTAPRDASSQLSEESDDLQRRSVSP